MLRLTRVMHGDEGITLIVEGRIVAEWGDFLARECSALRDGQRGICLDLAGVTYVDARGAAHIRMLAANGIQLARTNGLLAELLQENGHD